MQLKPKMLSPSIDVSVTALQVGLDLFIGVSKEWDQQILDRVNSGNQKEPWHYLLSDMYPDSWIVPMESVTQALKIVRMDEFPTLTVVGIPGLTNWWALVGQAGMVVSDY